MKTVTATEDNETRTLFLNRTVKPNLVQASR